MPWVVADLREQELSTKPANYSELAMQAERATARGDPEAESLQRVLQNSIQGVDLQASVRRDVE